MLMLESCMRYVVMQCDDMRWYDMVWYVDMVVVGKVFPLSVVHDVVFRTDNDGSGTIAGPPWYFEGLATNSKASESRGRK